MKANKPRLQNLCIALTILFCNCSSLFGQLSGPKYIPGNYPSLTAAVAAVNASGVGAGGVTFNIAANYTETISATISLTATGTALNPIVFQKDPATSGSNPVITAYTGGIGTPATAIQDGIWKLIGSDYVTIDGIDLADNPANTTNPSTMEYGYALYKASTSNGCQFVTIQNCVITLNKINSIAGVLPMADGSTGILVTNALSNTATTSITPIAGGAHSNNKFYTNTIQNCNTGIALIGYAAASPFTLADTNNDIGGSTALTGNTILNYGGATGATTAAAAILTQAQYTLNVSYNITNNNNGSGANHPNILRGIYITAATSANATITYNTVTVKGGGTTQAVAGIENSAGSTAAGNTINISNNTVTNSTYTSATTGGFYGIYNSASPATLMVNNNTVSNNSSAATAAGFFYGILNTGVATSVAITSNTLTGNSTAALTTGLFVGIFNSASAPVVNINSNTVAGNSTPAISGVHYAIYNSGTVTTTLNINSNNIGAPLLPAITFTAANSGAQILIYTTRGTAAAAVSINSNNFYNVVYAAGGTSSVTFISNTAATLSQAINNNTFTNLNINTTGNVLFISNNVIVSGTGNQNVNGNNISGSFTKAAGGTITLFSSLVNSLAGSVINNNNNNFSNITVTGATTIAGWINTDAGASTKTIQNNTFSNWSGGTGAITALAVSISGAGNATTGNTISNISSAGSITGITTGTGNNNIYSNNINTLVSTGTLTTVISGIAVTGGTTQNIYGNTIYGLQGNNLTTGSIRGIVVTGGTTVNLYQNTIYSLQANVNTTGTVNGIWLAGGTNATIYRNKIYDLSSISSVIAAGGGVNGIQVSGATASVNYTLHNNVIGDLRTPSANLSEAIRGLSLITTGVTSNIKVYFNTIYLNASSVGVTFGSSGIYHTTSALATTATLTLRNNIITNISTPSGTGLTVAFRRSSSTLTNYSSSSNNNLFFGGLAATNRLLFYDAVNSDQLLTTYKTRMATRDAQSVTEDLVTASKFLSTSGASSSFLHLDPLIATQAESGAVNIAGITDDLDANIRQGNTGYAGTGTAPDMGADEMDGIGLTALSGTYNVGAGQIYTSLTDAGGLFEAINSQGLSGNLIVNITSNLTENGTNPLYEWAEQGAGNYSLTIQPDNSTMRIISGNVPAGLIRFNGADRVIIDGSNGGSSNFLTFRNSNTAGTTGTAFTFINGATNNQLSYIDIEAYANATNGVILFSTSTIAGGNSNNQVSNCNINGTVSGNTSNLCIYSAGTVGRENSTNTLTDNKIYDYRDRALDISATGSTAWTISGNSFYNGNISGAINYAAASILHGIRILGGAGYSILNNYIGSNASLAAGTNAVYSSTTGNVANYGILLTTSSASPASNIQGNTVSRITISSVPTAASSIAFIGIETNGSGINIGGSLAGEGNIIGSVTSNGSIAVTTTTTSTTYTSLIRGINCNSTGGIVTANQAGGVDIRNIGAAPAPSVFTGINISNATAPTQVTNNTIGIASVTNSIRVLPTSTALNTSLSGITVASTVISTVLVDGNTVQNISNLNTANTTGGLTGISSSAATAAANITISNNTIASLLATIFSVGTGTPTSSYFIGINNAGAAGIVRINNNTIRSLSTNSTAGNFNAIRNTGAVITTLQINNNQIGNSSFPAITFNAANSGSQIFINNTGGAGTASLSISNNNFQGVIYSIASTGTNNYILNSAATLSQAINGNTFTSLSVNTSGSLTFISNNVVVSATGSQNVNNNSIITSFTKRAGGTLTLFTSSATSISGSIVNNNSNNFSNITVTGATTIAGWVNTDAGSFTKTIQNNIFSNWVGGTSGITAMSVNLTGTANATTGNTISNISSAGAITAITTAAGNDNIFANTINTISSTGVAAVTGIAVTGGTTKNIYKNKIYDLSNSSATGTVNGMLVSGGTTVNVYNNLVGDLRMPIANSGTDLVRGINITSATASSTINVYYNTIYINATSAGTNFSSTGIYHTINATATTAALNLRNNIITNTSTPNGTGRTVAYRRSGTTFFNYASASNNNLFYAGTPSASRLIFFDGATGDQTLAAYKLRVATADAVSVTEDLTAKFASVSGASALFLHINTGAASLIESGAVNIAGFTDDADGQIRAGNPGYIGSSISPDIGADEIFGVEITPPLITYTLLANTTSATNRNITGVSITDGSGVNTTAGTKPRIYYKRFTDANAWLDNTSNTNGWKFTEATNNVSPFDFTIDYSILNDGPAVTAGIMQYFIVAQDIATTANIAINSGTFTIAPTSVALTAAAFPITGTINSYTIPFAGSYSIGAGEIYTSLTKADGLFAAVNSAGLMNNVTVNIVSDITEDGANALNQWSEFGVGNYALTIQPDAATLRTISGNVVAGLIRLDGANRVTIDGRFGGSGSYLGFKNTNTPGTTGTAFTFLNGASNNTIKYTDVKAYTDANNGVIHFGTSVVAGGNSSNLITNCTISSTVSPNTGSVAIYSGGTIGNENSSNTISSNNIYGYRDRGLDITATGSTAWTISNNSFYNGLVAGTINYAASSALHGIRISGGAGYSILNNYIGGKAALTSGGNAVYSSTLGNVSYQGISLTTTSSTPASDIKGNTIAAISLSVAPVAANANTFTGIETNGAGINIGGTLLTDGNLIGSASGTGSVIVTTSTVSTTYTSLIKGINNNSTGGFILHNKIAGIDINNIGTAPASSSFNGIYVNGVTAPAQVNNNIIGSAVTNSIRVLAASSATTTSLNGITIGTAVNSAVQLDGNIIKNFSHGSNASSGNFTGIDNTAAAGAAITISHNTIQNISTGVNANSGSSFYVGITSAAPSVINDNLVDNITLSSNGTNAQVKGIDVSGAFAHTVQHNIISNLSTASSKITAVPETGTPSGATVVGILNSATIAGQSISENTIFNLNATNISAINTVVTGIGVSSTASGNIFNNRIVSFTNKATGASPAIIGIAAGGGSFNAYNNVIKIDNSSNTNGVRIYGINHAAGNNWNYYHNSVSIAGNATGTAARSAAFIRPVSGTLELKNNVFVNIRTGTGSNYAISNPVSPAATNWAATTSNYNDLYSSNTNTTGEWGPATNQSFAQWQSASAGETNSVNSSVSFITSPYDLQPDSATNCSLNNSGTPITSPILVNADINTDARSSVSPDMGAYEFNWSAFILTVSNNSPVCAGGNVDLSVDPGTAISPTYTWKDATNSTVSTIQDPIITGVAGVYAVTVTDINGCNVLGNTTVAINQRPSASLTGTSVCSGNSVNLVLTVTGSGTLSGTLSDGTIFSGTAPSISIPVSPVATTSIYIADLDDAACSAIRADIPDTVTVLVTNTGDWLGTNTNWNDPANWCGGVPASINDVNIPAGLSFYPVISSGTVASHDITIATGASLTVTGGTLQIAGDITNAGTFTAANGAIEMNGAAPQMIPANAFLNNTIGSLLINNNVTLGGQTNVSKTLSFGNSGLTLNTGNMLTLTSNASGTARVAPLPVNGAGIATSFITGTVSVERYFNNRRAWRLITSPLSNAGNLYNAWQNAGVYQSGKGIFITGPTPSAANGLDASAQNSVSIKTYNPSSQVYVNVANTKTTLLSGSTGSADNIGYFTFVRGDRDPANLNGTTSNSTTLKSTGILQTGKQVFAATTTYGGYTLMGNPYASPVDFNGIGRTQVMKRFYAWDPTLSQVGGYVVLDDLDGDGIYSKSVPSSAQDKNIQSGQAFFVLTDTAGTASISYYESSKSSTVTNTAFRPQGAVSSFVATLYLANTDGTTILADALLAEFDNNYSAAVNLQDAAKFANTNETLGLLRNGTLLAIERRPVIAANDTLFFKLTKTTARNYQFAINMTNMAAPGLMAMLEDKYTGVSTPLNMNGSTMIDFNINGNAASSNADRFRVVFSMANTLPVTYTSVTAKQKGKSIEVNWKVEEQLNIQNYEVEKSVDGSSFVKVNTRAATNATSSSYNWTDMNAITGDNYYRIRNIDRDGSFAYSKIVKVNIGKTQAGISVYPNPVTGGVMNVQLTGLPAGVYTARLISSLGQVVMVKEITHAGSDNSQSIHLPKEIAKGTYRLEIVHPDKITTTTISIMNQ
ncbi:MAG: hypothetical protein ABIN67_01545 [Ferruginibacter sp.]